MKEVLLVFITAVATLSASFGALILGYRYDKRRLYRQKLEAVVEATYEDKEWLDRRQSYYVYGDLSKDLSEFSRNEPFARAQMLVDLYFFVDLAPAMLEIRKARNARTEWQSEQRIQRMRDQAAWLAQYADTEEQRTTNYNAYIEACSAFETKARAMMERALKRSR